jgi:hypothetical protein
MLKDRAERNRLRQAIMAAEKNKLVSKEEIGFIVTLVERFRSELDKKQKAADILQGEIAQLRFNESIIMNLIENMIAAAERAQQRQQKFEDMKNEAIENDGEEIIDQTEVVNTEVEQDKE